MVEVGGFVGYVIEQQAKHTMKGREMRTLVKVLLSTLLFCGTAYSQALDRTHVNYTSPLQYGATCDDVTLNATITAIGSTKTTLVLTRTDRAKVNCNWVLSANVTTNVNTNFYIPEGVVLSPNATKTITFNGPVQVDDVESLQGGGSFVFNYDQSRGVSSFISSGCTPTVPAASMTFAAFACSGVLQVGSKVFDTNQTASAVTLSGADGTFWLAFDFSQTRTVAGWTRTAGTHYLWQLSATQPTNPSGAIVVEKITVLGQVITALEERGNNSPLPSVASNVVQVHLVRGTSFPKRIANAVSQLPATGGTVDARGLQGPQTIDVTIPSVALLPITYLLAPVTYSFSASPAFQTSGNSSIIGAGQNSTILVSTLAGKQCITINGANVTIRSLTCTGFNVLDSVTNGITSGGQNNALIEQVTVEKFGAHGINTGVAGCCWTIRNSIIQDNFNDGILIAEKHNDAVIVGNQVLRNQNNGIDLTAQRARVEYNRVFGNGVGFALGVIDRWGILIQSLALADSSGDANYNGVGHNIVDATLSHGIIVRSVTGHQARGNVIVGNKVTNSLNSGNGINLNGGGGGTILDTVISGNTSIGNGGSGIEIDCNVPSPGTATNSTIIGNTVETNAGGGINVRAACVDNVITGNVVLANTGTQIFTNTGTRSQTGGNKIDTTTIGYTIGFDGLNLPVAGFFIPSTTVQVNPIAGSAHIYVRNDANFVGAAANDCALIARLANGTEVLITAIVTDGPCP